jgi:hypothetical protein
MVCYARPAAWLAIIVAVAWLVFARPAVLTTSPPRAWRR